MRSLATVVGDIRTDLNRGSTFDDRIKLAIQNTIHTLRDHPLGFNSKRAGLAVSAEYVTLPDDLLALEALRLDDGAAAWSMVERTNALDLEQRRTSQSLTGQPCYYALTRDGTTKQLRLYPPPDATYSCQLTYLFDAATSASWTDSLELAWFDDARIPLHHLALAEVLASFISDEEAVARARMHTSAGLAAFRRLQAAAGRIGSSGGIEPCL